MGNIVLLDELTINKIAAGEVIERPASVVKEMIENSIDAGATNISVEIKNGGISYIRITDNGKGIMPDDMEMAFERHATSKIRKADDLETVTSMGFRGEALASIAAISHVEIVSKAEGYEIGCKVEVQGGNIINREDAGCPQGTTITVTDLFYNTPVRYKFLKKDFTEAGYIEDVITRISLIHPEVAFKLISSGKTVIQTSGKGDMKSVIYNIYGKDVAENIIDIDYDYEDLKVTGVIGKPIIARSNRSNQLFFVNKRYVKDKTLSSAAEQGYKGLLTIGKYGFVILNIEMNPSKVDVNVHPAKLEVRFEDENKVFKAVYHSIKDSLLKVDLVPDKVRVELHKEENGIHSFSYKYDFPSYEINKDYNKKSEEVNEVNNISIESNNTNISEEKIPEIIKQNENDIDGNANNGEISENGNMENLTKELVENEVIENETKTDEPKTNNQNIDETIKVDIPVSENLAPDRETKKIDLKYINEKMKELDNLKIEEDYGNFEEMYAKTFGTPIKENKVMEKKEDYQFENSDSSVAENVSIFDNDLQDRNQLLNYKFIGIAFNTYIIIELNKEIYMIDQHAAHERILYEKVKENYYSEEINDSQLMLIPDIINLSNKDMQIARDNFSIFEKAGFMLEEFGENTIKLTGVPNICIDLDTKELFLETLDEINTVARTAKQEIEEKFIATIACKAAVKANMVLTREEVDDLINQLLLLPNPFTCPHGRPTTIRMTRSDLERKFSRR